MKSEEKREFGRQQRNDIWKAFLKDKYTWARENDREMCCSQHIEGFRWHVYNAIVFMMVEIKGEKMVDYIHWWTFVITESPSARHTFNLYVFTCAFVVKVQTLLKHIINQRYLIVIIIRTPSWLDCSPTFLFFFL